MLIVCPTCTTSYDVEPGSLGHAGRSVRCARCRAVWFAAASGAQPQESPAAREPVRAPEPMREPEPVAEAAGGGGGGPTWSTPYGSEPGGQQVVFAIEPTAPPEPEPEPPPIPVVLEELPTPPAETVLIVEAPPLVPTDLDGASPPVIAADVSPIGSDIELIATRRMRAARQRRRKSSAALPVAIAALIAINAALLIWRAEVVRLLPQTAGLYAAIHMPVNLRGLAFADIRITKDTQDGVTVIAVEGMIENGSDKPVDVPRLRFAVRNEAGQEIYSWTALPSRNVLPAREGIPFRSRLASPPAEGRDVVVRFFTRGDTIAGIK